MLKQGLRCLLIFCLFFYPARRSFSLSDSLELSAGFLQARLDEKEDYGLAHFALAFNFDTAVFSQNPRSDLQFQVEPFLGLTVSPDDNIELGCNFLFKYSLTFNELFSPYIKVGVGPAYTSQHTREQGSQFNFVDTAGLGLSFLLKKDSFLNLEYRFRHMSNASFKKPNRGIDFQGFFIGFMRKK